MMNKIRLYTLTFLSLVLVVGLTKPAAANYCELPSNIDPTGILCQTQQVIDGTQPLIQQAEAEAAERQSYLQQLYNNCMSGYSDACSQYNYEMQRQLRHMDNVNQQYQMYLHSR